MATKKPATTNYTPDEQLYLKAKEAYYKGEPIMSDEDFDILEDTLRNEDSFVVEIVGTSKKGPKLDVPHPTPMLSLDKVKFKKNYVPYQEAVHKLYSKGKGKIIYEPKLDGNAITITYENGNLISIASRGTGVLGQNYTDKLKSKVPAKIKDFTGEVRGECVIDTTLFDQKYLTSEDPTAKTYKNARNFVAGILSSDIDKTVLEKLKDIDFVAFDVKGLELEEPSKWLASKGFEVLDFTVFTIEINEETFVRIYKEFAEYRETCKYQLDGIVAKFVDPKLREELGETGHHPNWALAIKFVSQQVSTGINGIELGMTKRGELAPVALLDPVELMGSTVRRASLYNASWMIANRCYPGAEVSIIKSGDIIPVITGIVKPAPIL